MGDTRPRLLLVEDDPKLGPIMAGVLDEVYDVVLIADGAAALEAVRAGRYDVLIVDRRLPSVDGITIVETLRRGGNTTPALILSALATVQDKVRGLDAGANDYLVKPFEFEELFARLRAIRRTSDSEGPVLAIGSWEFFPDSRAVYSPYDGRKILTERESDLLRLLAAHPHKTFSRDEILHAVFDATDTPGTVDTYVHYLRRKTDPEIVTTVRGRGYRLGML
jgi:two-component system response regulator QseB